ncbi:DUF2303 family protein [Streptomyces sp. DASNCL29]|uniref:DUF2303 family protein n=1 Tax=Streptomyces sp. DASNCL29 TaxID=2583819 RepID=UPI00110F75E5|nr:DUF2303 family protein [Streptomyces sp. DASNCL29]TMU98069.1 DUF2303 family protein [Streptomyces sp. DASNCL29]
MTNTDNANTIANLALRSAPPVALELGKVHAFHTSGGVHTVDLTGDKHRDTPARKTGTTTVRDAESFLTYWGKHHDDATEVYADGDRLTITAILDAHQTDAARWGQHRLHLALRTTDAWQQWAANDGKLLGQEQFAEFIEDHLPELLEPAAATMLEIAQSIQATTKAEFQSGTRLQSGERQLKYVEDTRASAGRKGELTIPETFIVGLVPFEGSEGYKVTARLRYRIGDGQLRIGYKLDRPDEVRRTAFDDVRKAVAEQLATAVMNGTPA